jgi:predicted RNase H-like HicB family nuclease
LQERRDDRTKAGSGMAYLGAERSFRGMTIEIDREDDGRWLAEVTDLPGVIAYGPSREDAVSQAKALALRVIADRLDHGEEVPDIAPLFAEAA